MKDIKLETTDIVEKTTKKTIHGSDKVATSEQVVENLLGKKVTTPKLLKD